MKTIYIWGRWEWKEKREDWEQIHKEYLEFKRKSQWNKQKLSQMHENLGEWNKTVQEEELVLIKSIYRETKREKN